MRVSLLLGMAKFMWRICGVFMHATVCTHAADIGSAAGIDYSITHIVSSLEILSSLARLDLSRHVHMLECIHSDKGVRWAYSGSNICNSGGAE